MRKLLAALFILGGSVLLCFNPAAATTVTATSGYLSGFTGTGNIDVSGPDFHLVGTIEIFALISVGDCVFCSPGDVIRPFWSFDKIFTGTLTWNGVESPLIHETVSGNMISPPGVFVILPPVGPAFSVDMPFTLSVIMPGFDLTVTGAGVYHATFSPGGSGGWVAGPHFYPIGFTVPEPNPLWLLLAGLPVLAGGVRWAMVSMTP
jgi:hypothetical protein